MYKTAITVADLPSPAVTLPAGVSIIDVITFVAEMASKPQEIDILLDPLRRVTSLIGQTSQLTSQDLVTLRGVYDQVEVYLTTREPLRQFTVQSIRRAVYAHLEESQPKPRATRPLVVIWLAAIGLAAAGYLLLPPVQEGRIVAGFAGIFITFYTGAAWLFWVARKNFKETLRTTYLLLCTGIILVGGSFLQGLVTLIFQLENVPWMHNIGTYIPVIASCLVVYFAMLSLGRILGMKLRIMSPWFTAALALALGLGLTVAPHPHVLGPEWMFKISLLLQSVSFVYVGCAGIITALALGKLAPYYKVPMSWLTSTFALLAISYGLVLAHWFVPAIAEGILALPLVLGSLMALKAGISFYRLKTV
jgi:hypothetical protein